MKTCWDLPESLVVGGRSYGINWDFRAVLSVLSCLSDPKLPELLRWRLALQLFYREEIPFADRQAAIAALAEFIRGGEVPRMESAPKLYDWEQDAPVIIAEVNKVAGRELRREKSVHWWTFLGWFHGIGQGRFSFLVCLRDKLRRGEKLTDPEERFYRENSRLVDLPVRYTRREEKQRQALLRLLDGE